MDESFTALLFCDILYLSDEDISKYSKSKNEIPIVDLWVFSWYNEIGNESYLQVFVVGF